MRLIDADHLRRWILSRVFKTQLSVADIIDQIDREDTIEPDSDTVSRQAAIEAVEFGITYAKAINKETGEVVELFRASNNELRKAVDRIKQLPPSPSRPQWIPCSKRLPEVGAVLITDGNEILIGEYHVDSTWSVDGCDYNPDLEKIAWMPLPEPYKGAEQSKSTHA